MSLLENFSRPESKTALEKLAEAAYSRKEIDLGTLDAPLFEYGESIPENVSAKWLNPQDRDKSPMLGLDKLIASLDKDFGCVTQENRSELPPVCDETCKRLEDNGWSQNVLDHIDSEAEANIYEEANVRYDQINGKDVLCKEDIDYDQTVDEETGETNLDRMKMGKAPLDKEGNPIELHHIGQGQSSPLVELTRAEHRGVGNDNILHNKVDESRIDREDFARERAGHWKARAVKTEVERQA